MELKDLAVGTHETPLSVSAVEIARVHSHLLRITLEDKTGKINLIFEGQELCTVFSSLKAKTNLTFKHYSAFADAISRFAKYFPLQINPNTIVEHGTGRSTFILVTANALPEMRFSHWNASLLVCKNSSIGRIDLSALYTRPETSSFTTTQQFVSLEHLRNLVGETYIPGSCYAIVLDSNGPYIPSNSADALILLKITDESLYPEFAHVQVFHQPTLMPPKVVSYGDVICVQNCMFTLFKGVLTGTVSVRSMSCGLTLFTLESEDLTPYGQYKGFFTEIDHHQQMLSIRRWAKHALSEGDPLVLGSLVTLCKAQSTMCDVLARFYAKSFVGVDENDPIILFLYDAKRSTSMIIDRSRSEMTKCIVSGETIRIRSVTFEENRLLPSCFTDILKIPPFLRRLQLPSNTQREDALQRIVSLFLPQKGPVIVSTLILRHRALRVSSFAEIGNAATDFVRTKGFVVRADHTLAKKLALVLWDGKSDRESDLLRVFVKKQNASEFLNGHDWLQARNKMVNSNSVLEVVLMKKKAGLFVTGTSLKA